MVPQHKKVISILLVSVFLLSVFSIPLIALAQQQGQQLAQNQPGPQPQEPKKDDKDNKNQEPQETPITWGSGVINLAVSFIANIISGILAIIIYLEAYVINYILGAFQFTKAPIVTLGWGITRDLANMLFILALIIIAISTILRVKAFPAQQMLWRVIIAALLVNFSLVIGGIIIDFTQTVTQYFIKAATGDGVFDFASRLASSMKLTAFYAPGTGPISMLDPVKALALSTFGNLFKLIALIIAVFVFGATAIFLVLRVAWLWLYLLAAPLVWALWAFPGQSKWFGDWWSGFLKWAFFAPVYAVSIFLALSMATKGGFSIVNNIPSSSVPQAFNQQAAYVSASAPQVILQFIVMTILFIAPLIIAQKIGITGAKAARGATEGVAKATALWVAKSSGGLVGKAGARAASVGSTRSPAVKAITAPIRAVGAGFKTLGGVVTRIPAVSKTPINPLMAIYQGAKSGSGLFKKKQTVGLYECQNCNHREQSMGKPTFDCPNCGSPATLPPGAPAGTTIADWQQI
ncbi:hypothetical protein A2833_01775 [Candidatus Azambacteria bacterium RIFCSPHIGHO2_01_FULL_44_55]|uniref:TrbL/VirB6 plasmid conjugal transfer protein n=1 Tax=Candidatus Azambacteria bacterium RIFCSPLOWO2_02_FULL_44_14 TaxID=1797306 RepID=A0A1F5CB73_9BACT|nr:MAG: hypothetical protein A3A18_01475 [Candidatus Azambacteria bacterium RIFCSPLOWO2_01_FULL_44_84]OGD33012.1 MAG: hypothetical protein A3C78_01370 [Candidatus Azambacteria bacterium RIFCSPHIGHO2_02_FULL_45_18]OGD39818.1 MAG: hypothetical protein A2833_01775 [Candidatus Azambacteria bacterium RIFCSPHIGHO2_01_FULL_44_55]OGD40058.1 MAG: hypothetical protein A3I30_02425 [Candidatus Azambacteria bacterium RIFCSPLOWO2_02_FULL_44_14]OGD51520.1 MAG: hypothetical protein A2608_00630 [Candidatus Azam